MRRSAYEACGGYWASLFYAHEELDIAWRMRDVGYTVRYLADVAVTHPRSEIGRHPGAWWYTGRNRIMVARRNLPWIVALPHVAFWLVVGTWRAPTAECRRSYGRGWLSGWTEVVRRRPIRWRTVLELARIGRPPII